MLANQKTTLLKLKGLKQDWWLVDLKGQTVGRMATRIANILRGKHKPAFTPNIDGGDFVVAVNAAQIHLTGKKWDDKTYYRHSGYPGGFRSQVAKELLQKHPDAILMKAVKGMLPKNFLSDQILKKLKVYPGAQHPHAAQNPKPLPCENPVKKKVKEKKEIHG